MYECMKLERANFRITRKKHYFIVKLIWLMKHISIIIIIASL